jgi:alanyl aminopeptidase
MRFLPLVAAFALVACSAAPLPPAGPAPIAQPQPMAQPHLPAGPVPPARDDGRLPALARLRRYDIELILDPAQPTFAGIVSFDLDLPEPTAHIVLHARDLTVTEAHVERANTVFPATTAVRLAHGAREAPEELVVSLPDALPAGEARLVIRYQGRFNPELTGLYRVQVDGRWYAFSDFEPTDARRAFPCFDEPSFKVPVRVRLTVPQDVGAFANMPEASHADDPGAHTRAVLFDETPPLPSYLVAFAVGPFDVLEGPAAPVPVRVLAPRGRAALGAYAARVAGEHLGILARYFDRPYPFPKLDLVAVPDFQSGAMENPGLITFRDTALLLDEARASARTRYYTASIVAHELAHQWFGNLVTMAWWDDLWLNEGFATWMGTRVMDAWQPALGARIEAIDSAAHARHADALPTAHAVRQRVTSTGDAMASFDAITYDKGAAVIGMIESWVGATPFREGIRAYLRDHAGGNATAADLLGALSASSGRDVTPVAESFLDQVGVPLVRAALDCAPGHPPRVTLTQSRFRYRAGEADATRWRIPVCVRFDATPQPRTQCTVLADERATVDLEAARCPRWIDPNAGSAGYYVSASGAANTRALLRTPGALGTASQLDLLSSLEAQVIAGTMPITTWLDALAHLAQDPDAHLYERVANSMFTLRRWVVDDQNRAGFQRWAGRVLGPLARALGWRTQRAARRAQRDGDAHRRLHGPHAGRRDRRGVPSRARHGGRGDGHRGAAGGVAARGGPALRGPAGGPAGRGHPAGPGAHPRGAGELRQPHAGAAGVGAGAHRRRARGGLPRALRQGRHARAAPGPAGRVGGGALGRVRGAARAQRAAPAGQRRGPLRRGGHRPGGGLLRAEGGGHRRRRAGLRARRGGRAAVRRGARPLAGGGDAALGARAVALGSAGRRCADLTPAAARPSP